MKALYNKPSASIKTNGTISKPFQLFLSGCPASPSLFILALEPLVCAIRAERKITGIQIGGHDFKDNLFADDLLLTLSQPHKSIPQMMKLIEVFGKFSGYKVNFNKREAIPLIPMPYSSHLGPAPIQWKPQGMRYLGINIKTPIEEIFD